MLFVVRFTDKPDSEITREQQLAAHISWLDERRQSILVAGSLREDPKANPIGAFGWSRQKEKVKLKNCANQTHSGLVASEKESRSYIGQKPFPMNKP